MKYETKELTGHELNAAVAIALGMTTSIYNKATNCPIFKTYQTGDLDCGPSESDCGDDFEPSSRWGHGGPIIEREGIELWKWTGADGTYWCSHVGGRRIDTGDKESIGDTPLVAAMRAFVTAKLGAEVDL